MSALLGRFAIMTFASSDADTDLPLSRSASQPVARPRRYEDNTGVSASQTIGNAEFGIDSAIPVTRPGKGTKSEKRRRDITGIAGNRNEILESAHLHFIVGIFDGADLRVSPRITDSFAGACRGLVKPKSTANRFTTTRQRSRRSRDKPQSAVFAPRNSRRKDEKR